MVDLLHGAKSVRGGAAYVYDIGRPARELGKKDDPVKLIQRMPAPKHGRHPKFKAGKSRMRDVDYRDLAQKTLDRVTVNVDQTAVDYLATVIRKLSTGKPVRLTSARKLQSSESDVVTASDPLAAARARGRRYAIEQYENPDNLALLEARDYAGRNERAINESRQAGELYALLPPGKTRGFRYPKWQFDAHPDRVKAALRPFVDAGSNSWVIHSFMLRKREALAGLSPADVIVDDKQDIGRVIGLAESDLCGEQGGL
ncbi:hypothetical protein AB4Y32_39955 [Paraburkholderia phymatum]|uniref:Uncharacterized protein n=1 Tax=Paraburkholderia phymatum TaxID=148447 RepID=A0ACC6UDS7_9BURK